MTGDRELSPALPEELSSAEFERWLERTERDPRASEELDFLADLVAAAELEPGLRSMPLRPEASPFLARPWIWAAAASLLFASALWLWFLAGRERGEARVFAQLAPPRYIASELRSPEGTPDEGALDEEFPRAMELYARGDHAGAAAALEALLARGPHGPARFYLAACREQLGDGERAAADYLGVAEEDSGYLAAHARWRLANLLLVRGELERARAELEHLRAEGDFAANARALLERL